MRKKITQLKTFIVITCCIITVACSENEADIIGNENSISQSKGTIITADVALGEAELEMINKAKLTTQNLTRTVISPDGNGGLVYNWEIGKSIPLFVYITDGTKQEALSSVQLNIIETNKGRFTFTIPAGYNLANVKIAAATGKESDTENGAWATNMDNKGVITIGTPESIDATSNKYNIPLYAKLTPLSTDQQKVYMTFSMLGSWIGVRAKSDMYYATSLYSVAIESDVLHMDGKLNLNTETPVWTQGDYRINKPGMEISDTIKVKGITIGGTAGKGATQYSNMFYVWAKADATKASTTKAKVYVRDEVTSLTGSIYDETDKYSNRNKFYREANQVVQFTEGNTYNFGINASLQETDGGLIITEYYHSTLAVGEYNWIEITNATNKTISLEDYYLVSPDCDTEKDLYVVELKDLRRLDWKKRGMGYESNSTVEIPAGQSICLAAGQLNSGWSGVKSNGWAYQMVNTESGAGNISAVSGGIRLPKFLCKGGYNIDFNDPANNIVDNLGVKVLYDPAAKKFLTYAYYMGMVTFIRTKEAGMNVPQKTFLPHAWSYIGIARSGHKYLGKYNDKDTNYKPLAGYNASGSTNNFKEYNITMASFTKVSFRPDAAHPAP